MRQRTEKAQATRGSGSGVWTSGQTLQRRETSFVELETVRDPPGRLSGRDRIASSIDIMSSDEIGRRGTTSDEREERRIGTIGELVEGPAMENVIEVGWRGDALAAGVGEGVHPGRKPDPLIGSRGARVPGSELPVLPAAIGAIVEATWSWRMTSYEAQNKVYALLADDDSYMILSILRLHPLLLLLWPAERGTDQVGSSPQLDAEDSLNLAEECLVRYSLASFEIGNLHHLDQVHTVTEVLTSDGLVLTAVARSFCVILFPSGFVFACRPWAMALATLQGCQYRIKR